MQPSGSLSGPSAPSSVKPHASMWKHLHILPGHEKMIKGNSIPQDHPSLGGSGLAAQLEAQAVLVGHCCKGGCSLFYDNSVVFVLPTKVTSSPLNTVVCFLGTHFWVFFGRETSCLREVYMSIQGDPLT